MSVTGVGSSSALMLQSIGQMRDQLDDLQRQLGSGQKSTTYAGLGLDAGLTVGLRSQLGAIAGYQSTITQVGMRLNLMQTALSQFSSQAQTTKNTVLQSQYALGGGTQTQDQVNTASTLGSLVDMLNTQADGRYLFSGRTVDQEPVATVDHILNGDGLKAGLKQVIDERKKADLGADGLGRLVIGAPTATSISIAEDAVSPFGFKLVGATTNIAGATVSQPSGSPPAMSVDLAANPNPGDTIKFTFKLPDGSSQDLTLTATTASPPGNGQFTIGATPSDTAANLKAVLTQSVTTLAGTELAAASAIAAGNNFFDTDASHPPLRVDGSPYTATALRDGSADTVAWYTGDNATDDPRATAVALGDQSMLVNYGARANEPALRNVVKNLAVFSAVQFAAADPNGEGQYAALRERVSGALTDTPSKPTVANMAAQLANAQVTLNNANDRHKQSSTTLQNLLQGVQGAPSEQVAMQLMTLQTRLQATLQTTAMLLQTSLVRYL